MGMGPNQATQWRQRGRKYINMEIEFDRGILTRYKSTIIDKYEMKEYKNIYIFFELNF